MRTAAVYAYSPETRSSMAPMKDEKILMANLDEQFSLDRCAEIAKKAVEMDSRKITSISIEDYDRKKKYNYNIAENRLTIWEDGLPVYENWNGKICRDKAALADSLM